MRVLHVIDNLKVGGAQEAVRTLVEGMAASGCQPVVCAFEGGPLRTPIERLGVPVEILPQRAYSVPAFPFFLGDMLRIRRQLQEIIRKHRIEVVQTHLLRILDFVVLSLRVGSDLKVFWTVHNSIFTLQSEHLRRAKWMLGPKKCIHRLLYRLTARWVNGIVAVSDEVKMAIREEMGDVGHKIAVICNGVNAARYQQPVDRIAVRRKLGLPEEAPVVIVVASFKRQKGHCYLLEAATSVVRRFPRMHLLLVGDGDLRKQLMAQTARLGLEDRVHFLGIRHDVSDLLASSDCFVLPSLWEGLSVALLEAMAAGLPIIATAVAGTKQVMVHGQTGYLVPPGSIDGLEQAIAQVLSDPQRARSLGAAARQRVESLFGAATWAAQYLALYRGESVARPA